MCIRDSYGHIVGDELLTKIAGAMRHAFPYDITIRLGGDEFAIFLKGKLTPEMVKEYIERFFTGIRAIRLNDAPEYEAAISVGVAFTPDNDETITFEALYSKADKNLYKSKEIKGCSIVL